MHKSIALNQSIELINVTPLNPLISKCQIKVCYVQDTPNRNRSVITKETAKSLANSLPGSPIVGYFNETSGDFEEHNRIIDISNGKLTLKATTKPYGFVDLSAKVWFQKFLDDDEIEREYLVTEGYLWTGQYPECGRILETGNGQSMELSEQYLDAHWTKDSNGKPEFFIINEAIISNLCILGEDVEPCFEGASITAPTQFSFEESFKEQLFSMMNEIKEILNEGGAKVFNTYAVEIGDALWSALWNYIHSAYPDPADQWCSLYSIDGIFEENGQKFAVLRSSDLKYYRLNFSVSEETGLVCSETLIEVSKSYVPVNQFKDEDVEAFATSYKEKKKKEEEKPEDEEEKEEDSKEPEDKKEEAEEKPADKEEEDEDEEKKKKKKTSYSIEEYEELNTRYSELQTQYDELKQSYDTLSAQNESLTQFKNAMDRKEKIDMINSFYMLSNEDKKEILDNVDSYSLHEIEAELSIMCVRNKVSFDLDENTEKPENPTTFNLDDNGVDTTPAWVKAALAVAKSME